ncbi:MAG: Hsp20/alpha crystallin family protein [Spirochaetes bacterium]|nr:Hsp20/alpha crystallin family protein [Spirochaetota bacterium]
MYPVYSMINDLVKAFDSAVSDESVYRERPLTNVYEKEDSIVVKAIVPGMTAEDISLEVVDNYLVIKSTAKNEEISGRYLRRERASGSFKKTVKLPYLLDRDKMSAKLSDGILTVELSKSEAAKPKKIEII